VRLVSARDCGGASLRGRLAVSTPGKRYNVAVAARETERYFAEDVANARDFLRGAAGGGGASALDRLRADLDDAWPAGCSAHRDADGRPHHVGLGRVMAGPTRWEAGFVHVDELGPLARGRGTFSANASRSGVAGALRGARARIFARETRRSVARRGRGRAGTCGRRPAAATSRSGPSRRGAAGTFTGTRGRSRGS